MNVRRAIVLVDGVACVAREARRTLVRMDRMGRGPALRGMTMFTMGVAVGALASRPDLRRRMADWMRDRWRASGGETAWRDGVGSTAERSPS